MARQKSPRPKPEEILAGGPPRLIAVANRLRAIIKAAIPEASELGYPGWRAIGYRHPEAGYACGIFPYKDHVKIYFEHGRHLPDEGNILEGDGRQTRYVLVRDLKDIKTMAFKRLLKASVEFKKHLPPESEFG